MQEPQKIHRPAQLVGDVTPHSGRLRNDAQHRYAVRVCAETFDPHRLLVPPVVYRARGRMPACRQLRYRGVVETEILRRVQQEENLYPRASSSMARTTRGVAASLKPYGRTNSCVKPRTRCSSASVD